MPTRANTMHEQHKQLATEWAKTLLSCANVPHVNAIVVDTETTGLSREDEVIEIAICKLDRTPILNTLVYSDREISPKASETHGITRDELATAPKFKDIYPDLLRLLTTSTIVGWNVRFDITKLHRSCEVAGLPIILPPEYIQWNPAIIQDAMLQYSAWVGDWNHERGSYRWQKLNGGHRAILDCCAVVDRIEEMAGIEKDARSPESAEAVIQPA